MKRRAAIRHRCEHRFINSHCQKSSNLQINQPKKSIFRMFDVATLSANHETLRWQSSLCISDVFCPFCRLNGKHSSSMKIVLGQVRRGDLRHDQTLPNPELGKEVRDVPDRLWSPEHKIRFRIDTHVPNWLTVGTANSR